MERYKLFHELFGLSEEEGVEVSLRILKWIKEGLTLSDMIKQIMTIEDKKVAIATAFRLGYYWILDKFGTPELEYTFTEWMALRSMIEVAGEETVRKVLKSAVKEAKAIVRELNDSQQAGFI